VSRGADPASEPILTPDPATRDGSPTLLSYLFDFILPKGLRKDSWRFRHTFFLGEIALFLIVILLVTGPLLMLRYSPTPELAYSSVEALTRRVPFGALLRSVHRIASYGLLAVLFLHLLRVFYTAAYKQGRALGWYSGVFLLLLGAGQCYTGYLLPWDQTGYWGTVVGSTVASYAPLIGDWAQHFLLGGPDLGAPTLLRFYVAHVVLIPGAIVAILTIHFYSLRKAGLSQPAAGANAALGAHSSPETLLKMITLFLGTLLAVLAASILVPLPLDSPADPGLPPNPARAPWFVSALQELVHYSAFYGGIVAPGVAVLLLLALPWLDRGPGRLASERRGVVAGGTLLVVVFLILTAIGNFFRGQEWAWRWPWAR
jgi:quinol-cytochrome oxidoreductase complex cytochrome b subunit